MMRLIHAVTIAILLTPGWSFAASKEQQEMQRDIAQLQDQVRTLQSGFDKSMASLQTLVQQALDAASKANTNVSVLNAQVVQTLARELSERLMPIAGVGVKVDNLNNDMAEVRNSLSDLTTQVNRLAQQLSDINNAIKVMQAPPAPPPPGASGAPGSTAPPPPAATMFSNAMNDYSSNKSDFAVSEFTDFLHAYPNDPNAPVAQLYIGQIHYAQQKLDQAVQDFDAVIEQYPDNKVTPDAYFMKGMSLKQNHHLDDAAVDFRALIKKYPGTDQAKQAAEQLRQMGLSTGTTPARRTTKKQ
jgi:TolA-binding protein